VLHVGLTGGLASGKSEVARRLTELGAVVFDADRIVAEMYGPGAPGSEAARELFGEAVLDASGRVDRARIAAIVFADPRRRHELEARIHPLVVRETERRFEEAEKRGVRVGVAEASQLLESGMEGRFDRVLLVVAPETQRIRRWEQKGGDPDDGRRRIAAQISPVAAFDRATDVIANDGTLDELRAKVDEVWKRWTGSANGRTSEPSDQPKGPR
jgi:dephospho-CoA kinase